MKHFLRAIVAAPAVVLAGASMAGAETRIRIMPPDGGILAAGQRFDIRVEATADGQNPPGELTVRVNGASVTSPSAASSDGDGAPANTATVLVRDFSVQAPGALLIEARTADGAFVVSRLTVETWAVAPPDTPRAHNIILLLGDGMGAAQRTAARLISRGVRNGRSAGRLAMDDLEVTGMVMTGSLNAVVTDSSPGMASYVTGQKGNNNQQGVFPDNTPDPFDNPRVEYLGEMLRRSRGVGFGVGIVTTSDVTDSTPAANAVHTSDRYAGAGIAARFFDERHTNGVKVLLGGGSRHFVPGSAGGGRSDGRHLLREFEETGYTTLSTAAHVRTLMRKGEIPERLLGLFHPSHMAVAFDKVGAGRYSDELARPENAAYRDTPMLEDLATLALSSLSQHSPDGFYLMIEGASIDKRAHAADAERSLWDVIEFDRAVHVAMEFARRTNSDEDLSNDTLVVVTGDHECGGMAILGVGNERYAPRTIGKAVRDYAAMLRFAPDQQLLSTPNYTVDSRGYPVDPDPSRKLLLGWAAAPDHYQNWLANRRQAEAAVAPPAGKGVATANPERDGPADPIAGFLVSGIIENGATPCVAPGGCPADTASVPHTIAGHTATDVPLSASGPGAWQFSGVYENTDVFLKLLRSAAGSYPVFPGSRR